MAHAPTAPARLEIQRLDGISRIRPEDWNRLDTTNNPFLSHAFLSGLEQFDCLAAHGWIPCPIAVFDGPLLVGAAPLYLRTDSFGEFVFDWAWADAWERAGGRYYPKAVCAVPFTPVRGPRLLVDSALPDRESVAQMLMEAILDLCERSSLSSFHCLFAGQEDAGRFTSRGLLLRKTCQFHWFNRGYRDFQDFLDALSSKRRKQIRRERQQSVTGGLEIEILHGGDVDAQRWQVFHDFYCATFHKRWGNPRLNLDFLRSLGERLPSQVLLLLARRGRRYVAGSFSMCDGETLYGRHWGCVEELPFLHFELCYYRTIEYCIQKGLGRMDAGVQGEHKVIRGFEPVAVSSCHWIAHAGFRAAVEDFLRRETPEVDAYIRNLKRHLPYKAVLHA